MTDHGQLDKEIASDRAGGGGSGFVQYNASAMDRFRTSLRARNEAKFHTLGENDMAPYLPGFHTGFRRLLLDIDVASIRPGMPFQFSAKLPKFFKILSDRIGKTTAEILLDGESDSIPSIVTCPLVAADYDCNGIEWSPIATPRSCTSLIVGFCFPDMVVPTLYPTLSETPYAALIFSENDIWIPQNSPLWSVMR